MRHSLGTLACASVALTVAACGAPAPERLESLGVTRAGLTMPTGVAYLDFGEQAAEATKVALTFDDGPEHGGTTLQTLDVLQREQVRATFFVNTDNAIDLLASSSGRLAVQRMVAEGHQVGSHTVHHASLGLASTDVVAELTGVVEVLRAVAPAALSVRLVRAPYGAPYFGPQDRLDVVAPVVARFGVHVGWDVDADDGACGRVADAARCVVDNVLGAVDAGRGGIILLHSIHAHTVQALPTLLGELRKRGKTFVSVEELVVAKYAAPSRTLLRCDTNADCAGARCVDQRCTEPEDAGPGAVSDAASSEAASEPDTPFVPGSSLPPAPGDPAISAAGCATPRAARATETPCLALFGLLLVAVRSRRQETRLALTADRRRRRVRPRGRRPDARDRR